MDPQGQSEHKLLSTLLPEMPPNPSKPCQEPTRPYANLVGVVEDRSVLIGFPNAFNEPTGSLGTIVVKYTPPDHPGREDQRHSPRESKCGGKPLRDLRLSQHCRQENDGNALRSVILSYEHS